MLPMIKLCQSTMNMNLNQIFAKTRSLPGSDVLHLQHLDAMMSKGWARLSLESNPLHWCLDAMKCEPGAQHHFGLVLVKKLVQNHMLRLAS